MRLRIRPPLRNQSNSNKSYPLALRKYFEAKATATNHTSANWGTASKPKQRQQIVNTSIGAPLRNQSNGNKSYILALGTTSKPKQRQQIVHLSIGAPWRPKQRSQIVHLSIGGHHFESRAKATNRISSRWGTTSRPKQQQQIVIIASRPKQRQHIVHLSTGGTTSSPEQRQRIAIS